MKVAIVDYGLGNLRSVSNAVAALEAELGAEPFVASQPRQLADADRVILPGVGAFGDGMRALEERGWTDALDRAVRGEGRRLLGICLGMQLLADRSSEHGDHDGLGWIAGQVTQLPASPPRVRVPHIGWNAVTVARAHGLYREFEQEADFYFVHSYRFEAQNEDDVSGWCEHGVRFAASLERDNISATQYHPEKSQGPGLAVLRNFLSAKD